MAFYLSEEECDTIMTMYRQKQTLTAIQLATGRDPKTIRKVITTQGTGHALTRRARKSKLDAYTEYIEKRWEQGCHNAQVLWEEIREQGFTGSLGLVKRWVAPLRPQRGVEPQQRYETDPGLQAQCDWADFGALVSAAGHRQKLYIFIYTMSYSRRMYVEFVHNERQETLFRCLEKAFDFFHCVPQTVLSDNMTPMVISHARDGTIVWNPRFEAFAAFHGFRPKAARPYRARTKGKVERGVRYVRQNFWVRVPDTIALPELNTRVIRWAQERDQLIHGTTWAKPADRWADDCAGATPYDPTRLWQFGESFARKVTADAFVHWQGHRFAVPWEAAGHPVSVRRQPPHDIVIYHEDHLLERYAMPHISHQTVGTEKAHATPPPARVPHQPIARRRELHSPDDAVPATHDLRDYEGVVPS